MFKDTFFTERLGKDGANYLSKSVLLFIGGISAIYACLIAKDRKVVKVTAVADMFFVTQPTLSRQIMNLESELGTQLFVRKSNTVTVTPAGMALYDGLKPLYGQFTRLIDSVRRYDELQRQTFASSIPTAASKQLIPWLQAWGRALSYTMPQR